MRNYAKNEVIKDYHQTEKFINILIKGAVGQFIWNNDKDICINLYYEHQFFSDYLSFLSQKKTMLKTEALEEVEIWSVSHQDLNKLYVNSIKGIRIGKAISDIMFIKKQTEQINLLSLSPAERYLKLIKERPEIFQRTTLKIIASYLGLTARKFEPN